MKSPLPLIVIALAAFALLFSTARDSAADAAIEYPEEIAARLQARYDAMQSLTFNFFQETRGEMAGRPRQGSGRALFYKEEGTGRMRWDYSSPDRQVLVSDGRLFRMYFAELNQMIVTPAENLDSELTYAFFTGKGNLQNDFHIRPADEESQGDEQSPYRVIKLIPRVPQSQVQDIHLWASEESLIRRLTIRDHFGTITVLDLSDIEADSLAQTSPEELAAIFSFSPPQGTEIINQ